MKLSRCAGSGVMHFGVAGRTNGNGYVRSAANGVDDDPGQDAGEDNETHAPAQVS